MIIGIMLSTLHTLMFPVLMVVFGMALQHFADHYNTFRYFRCIQDEHINCSSVHHCSSASNETNCCLDDLNECISDHVLLQKMDILTVLCIAIGMVIFASSWVHAAIFHYVGNNQMLRIRKKLFQSLVNQDIKWFDLNQSKEITSRMIE